MTAPKQKPPTYGNGYILIGPTSDVVTHLYSILNICRGPETIRLQYKDGTSLNIVYKDFPKVLKRDFALLTDHLIKEEIQDEYDV